MLALLPQWHHSIRQYLRLTVWIQRPRRTTCFLPKLRGQRGWAVTFAKPKYAPFFANFPQTVHYYWKIPQIYANNTPESEDQVNFLLYWKYNQIWAGSSAPSPPNSSKSGPFSSYSSQVWLSSPSCPLSSPFLGLVGSHCVLPLNLSPWHQAQKAV